MTSHNCTECKRPLPPINDARKAKRVTCSTKCRKRRERRQKEAHAAMYLALHELGKMRDSIKRGEQVGKMVTDLLRIKGEVADLLALAGEAEEMAKRAMFSDLRRKRQF